MRNTSCFCEDISIGGIVQGDNDGGMGEEMLYLIAKMGCNTMKIAGGSGGISSI